MKKVLLALVTLPLLFLTGCKKDTDLGFGFEDPQFDLDPAAMLIEVIVPSTTEAGDVLYMAGPATGFDEKTVIGEETWQLVQSTKYTNKFGIYIKPADLADGKTLKDGYYFVSAIDGREVDDKGDLVDHTKEVAVGDRLNNVTVKHWYEQYYNDTPADKFKLIITIPEYTPEGGSIGLFGEWNGWADMLENKATWTATQDKDDKLKYELLVDPNNFAEGTKLTDKFHIALFFDNITAGNWWKYQGNLDGSGNEGPGYNSLEKDGTPTPGSPQFSFELGKKYNINIPEWRNSDDFGDPSDLSVTPWVGLEVEAGKMLLQVNVPGYTPDNSKIGLIGGLTSEGATGWDTDIEKWVATMYTPGGYYFMLDPEEFTANGTLEDEFTVYFYSEEAEDWWYHKALGGNAKLRGAEVDNAYIIDVPDWDNAEEIEGIIDTYPETVSEDKYIIHLFVPAITPEDSDICILGDINGWAATMEDTEWFNTAYVNETRYVFELDPADFAEDSGLTKETTTNGFKFSVRTAEETNEWTHGSVGGNILLPNGAELGKPYNVHITGWDNEEVFTATEE